MDELNNKNDKLISIQDAIDALIEWYGCEPNGMDYFKEILAKKSPVQLTQNYRVNSNNALDTISRQEAIDAVCMEWCNVKHQNCEHPFDIEKDDYYWCDGCETALQTLPNLPSAQPEGIKYVELSEEDYEKMAELMRKNSLILTSAQPEITQEVVELYCRQRCLTVITNELFTEMKARWSAQPGQKKGKWIGGELGYCTCCGHEGCASDMWDRCETPYCPNCGAKMEKE